MDRYDKMGGDFDMHAGGFSELIGNEQIKEHFLHAISSGKVSHCYVISGEDGLGKMTVAKALHRHWSVRQNLPTDRAACAIHAHNF